MGIALVSNNPLALKTKGIGTIFRHCLLVPWVFHLGNFHLSMVLALRYQCDVANQLANSFKLANGGPITSNV